MAVGRITARLVANEILIARSAGRPVAVSSQYWIGTRMKPPPTPKRPEAVPTRRPVSSSAAR